MQFTPDGYTEPLPMRLPRVAVGLLIAGGGVAAGVFGWWCPAALLVMIGLLVAANEGGTKRIRVTRRHLLLEDEFRIWGLLVGPVRSRVRWEDTDTVTVEGNTVQLKTKDGKTLDLGLGGSEKELTTLRDRILQRLENFNNPLD